MDGKDMPHKVALLDLDPNLRYIGTRMSRCAQQW